jgi:replication factor C subunit 2/4
MMEKLAHIAQEEKLTVTPEILQAVLTVANGDMRKATTTLQSASQLHGSGGMTADAIIDVAGLVPPSMIDNLWASIKSNQFKKMEQQVDLLLVEGYSTMTILSALHELTVKSDLTDLQKAKICMKMAEADKCLIHQADEKLQLLTTCSVAMRVVCQKA